MSCKVFYFAFMKTTTDRLMSVSDYSKAHNMSLAWGYKQIKNKMVKTQKIGKTIFIITGK